MPAKKGKRENVKAETVAPENTEEPVAKKGRAAKEAATAAVATAAAEKPKKAPGPKGKAKKTAEDEAAVVPDVQAEEENGAEAKNGAGAAEVKPKRGRAKKDAAAPAKKTDEPVVKPQTRSRRAKQPSTPKEEPAAKVAKGTAKAPAKAKAAAAAAKEPKGKAAKAAAAKEEEEEQQPEVTETKEAAKPKGKAKGRGKQAAAAAAATSSNTSAGGAATTEENVVDEKGDAKVGTAAEGAEAGVTVGVDVEACKS